MFYRIAIIISIAEIARKSFNFSLFRILSAIGLVQDFRIAGVFDVQVKFILTKVKEGFELCKAQVFRPMSLVFGYQFHELEYVILFD